MVLGDYFSKYLLVRKMPSTSSSFLIREFQQIFTELGIPHTLKSDNEPQYVSEEFQKFLCELDIKHVTSSPYHPQSNGFAENLVKISKKLMDKATEDNKPWNAALLEYRTTPISSELPSPLQILTGRKPRTRLPSLPSANARTFPGAREVLLNRQKQQAEAYNRNTGSTLTPLVLGQPVWILDQPYGKNWKPAVVHEVAEEVNSYFLRVPDGAIYRRTRSMIRPRHGPGATQTQSPRTLPIIRGTTEKPVTEEISSTSPGTDDVVPNTSTPPPEVPLRRSARSTAGVPPQRLLEQI
jgi:hypothetical protein